MGKSSAEIQHDIERQRDALSARISGLEQRVRDDVSSVKENATNRVSNVADNVSSKTSNVLGSQAGADSALAQHPNTLVLGSLGAGLLLGLATGGDHKDDRHQEKPSKLHRWWNESIDMAQEKVSETKQSVSSESKGMAGIVIGSIQGWLTAGASDMVKAAVDGLTGGNDGRHGSSADTEARFEGETPAARAMEEPASPDGRPLEPAGNYERRAL